MNKKLVCYDVGDKNFIYLERIISCPWLLKKSDKSIRALFLLYNSRSVKSYYNNLPLTDRDKIVATLRFIDHSVLNFNIFCRCTPFT